MIILITNVGIFCMCSYLKRLGIIGVIWGLAACSFNPRNDDMVDPLYYHTVKLGSDFSLPIENPKQWAADNVFDCENAPLNGIRTMNVDVDLDGELELIVWDVSMVGQSLTQYLAFTKIGDDLWRYIGEFGAGRFKVISSVNGTEPRLVVYGNTGIETGCIIIYKNDGKRFNEIQRRMIDFNDRADVDFFEGHFGPLSK